MRQLLPRGLSVLYTLCTHTHTHTYMWFFLLSCWISQSSRVQDQTMSVLNLHPESFYPCSTLYWTDWNREAPKIECSSVDGQNRRVVVSDGIGLPNALTYDSSSGQICWADAGDGHEDIDRPRTTHGSGTWHRAWFQFLQMEYKGDVVHICTCY